MKYYTDYTTTLIARSKTWKRLDTSVALYWKEELAKKTIRFEKMKQSREKTQKKLKPLLDSKNISRRFLEMCSSCGVLAGERPVKLEGLDDLINALEGEIDVSWHLKIWPEMDRNGMKWPKNIQKFVFKKNAVHRCS